MAVIMCSIMFCLAITQLLMCVNVVKERFSVKEKISRFFIIMCVCGAVLCVGNGIAFSFDTDLSILFFSRIIAFLGIILYGITLIAMFMHWIDASVKFKALMYSFLGIVSAVTYVMIILDFKSSLYYSIAYKAVKMIMVAICSVIVYKSKNNYKFKFLSWAVIGCNLSCVLDFANNVFIAISKVKYYPIDCVLYFICVLMIYYSLISLSDNSLNIKRLSEIVYENVDAALILFDIEYKIAIINDFGTRFFNMTTKECVGKDMSYFFDVENNVLADTKFLNEVKCSLNNAVCSVNINRIQDKYGDTVGYMVFVNDQTELMKLMEAADEAKLAAEEASRAKSDFLAHMSHEIRTPINTIVGMNEMILRETGEKALIKYASNIKVASTSLLALVNDVLDFSKIESGKMELVPTQYDLDALLADEINTISFKAKEKGIKFFYDIDASLPRKLFGDDVRVRQIILNLLTNAVKYTSKGQIMFSVKGYMRDDNTIDIQVAVTDTGCGIKREDIAKLFEAFTRLDLKINRTIEGSGLGLNITNRLVKMMDGYMDVKSTYGKGSTFSCLFKQKTVECDCIGNFDIFYNNYISDSYTYHKSFEAPDAYILVVDDNSMNINVIECLLSDTKIKIMSVMSGEEAVKAAHDNYFDLIIMDHMMPNMDGMEAFNVIRADDTGLSQKVPIIAMTANAVAGAKQMYLQHGFSEYLSKPVDSVMLENMLSVLLPHEKVHQINTKTSDWIREDEEHSKDLEIIETMLEQKGVNAVNGMRNMNNSIPNYNETLRLFTKSFKSKLQLLRKLLEDSDGKNYGIEAHSMKSSAKLIGAENLAEICYKHEMAGRENRMEEAKMQWNELEKELNKTNDIVSAYIAEIDGISEEDDIAGVKKKDISPQDLRLRYANISELVNDYEHRDAMAAIEELMDYVIADNELEILKEVYKNLDSLDYDSAIDTINKLYPGDE